MSDQEWDVVKAHLDEVRQQYTDIGASGVPGLTIGALFGLAFGLLLSLSIPFWWRWGLGVSALVGGYLVFRIDWRAR